MFRKNSICLRYDKIFFDCISFNLQNIILLNKFYFILKQKKNRQEASQKLLARQMCKCVCVFMLWATL